MRSPPLPLSQVPLSQGGGETADDQAVAQLLAELPPITPNDLAVQRVWRRIESDPSRRSRPARPSVAWWGLIGAATVALVFLVATGPQTTPRSELAASSGGVFFRHGDAAETVGAPGQALAEDEHVRTDDGGHAVVRIPGVASMLLGSNSDVTLERLSEGALIHLTRGSLTSRVSKRSPTDPFIVQAGLYSVRVVGTLFTVEREPTGRVSVSVREGTVEVSDDAGQLLRVTAGTRWSSDDPASRTPDRTSDHVRALLEDGLSGRPRADLAPRLDAVVREPPGASAPAVETGPNPTHAPAPPKLSDAAPPITERAPATRRAGASLPLHPPSPDTDMGASRPAAQTRPTPAVDVSAAPAARPDPQLDVPSHAAAALAAAAAPMVDVDAAYQRAQELERKGDFRGAADELRLASEEGAPHAELALYELGRLAKQRLGDPSRALESFHQYRATYPSGALLTEVDLSILEIETATKHPTQEALSEASHFLTAHPDSDRVDEVRLLRGNLLRDRGEYSSAKVDYAAISDPRQQDDALYLTAYCQQRLGDRAGAIATLKAYLGRFPKGAHRAEALQALGGER